MLESELHDDIKIDEQFTCSQCDKCLKLYQEIYINKCSYKDIILRLNKTIEKQEEELEILKDKLRKAQRIIVTRSYL
tara:strand:- start:980 stop:1210 length:231 start_codon:yes stop_codon:yes gene_type:complete